MNLKASEASEKGLHARTPGNTDWGWGLDWYQQIPVKLMTIIEHWAVYHLSQHTKHLRMIP